MRKKTALVIGASGEIGGAFARELSRRGYAVYAPVRNLEKPEVQKLMHIPEVTVSRYNIENLEETDRYVRSLANEHAHIDLFVLAAGVWARDEKFPGATIEEKQQNAITELRKANVATKDNIYETLEKYFTQELKDMSGIVISSHAARFTPEHPYYGEQIGYITATGEVSEGARQKMGRFKALLLKEPGPINTAAFRKELGLTEDEAGQIPGILSPEVFAQTCLDEIESEKIAA